ncbi:MAG TPA: DUF4118 domain-containing protein [Burkholderiales bacterium]|nr:DUF4118 domain-containing protein [Burkholderiales bacterium]
MSAAVVETYNSASAAQSPRAPLHYAAAALICAVTTALAFPLAQLFDPPNIVMLFLLAVVVIAVWLGRGPAIMSAFLSVALFDFFFVPPTFSFTVHDVQYVFTFAVMLVVALVIGYLTASVKEQAQDAYAREKRTAALYGMARELAGTTTAAQAAAVVRRFIADAVGASAAVFLRGADGKVHPVEVAGANVLSKFDAPLVDLALSSGGPVEVDFNAYLPLVASARVQGVLAVAYELAQAPYMPQHRDLLAAVAALAAIVAERIVAENAQASREILE